MKILYTSVRLINLGLPILHWGLYVSHECAGDRDGPGFRTPTPIPVCPLLKSQVKSKSKLKQSWREAQDS